MLHRPKLYPATGFALALAGAAALLPALSQPHVTSADLTQPGCLIGPRGACPLKHTSVKARISGPLARVTVTQEFENPFQQVIEADYTFPLPSDAAIDDMTMHVGGRTIRGVVKSRDDARRTFEQARNSGRTASLLDQERPNIFRQSVTNIPPGAKVSVEIAYVETVPFEEGQYSFAFPMVVAPRYMPGAPIGREGGGWASDTTAVPDASRISPPVVYPGRRAGHDISLELSMDAGFALRALASPTHEISIERPAGSKAVVRLCDRDSIPNKDFILKYAVEGDAVADAVLTHRSRGDGYFTLLFAPPERPSASAIVPKEIVFLLDTSGSMSGFPIEKAKEAMRAALDGLNPDDTFNMIAFNNDTYTLFPSAVRATPGNLRTAHSFLNARAGSGGTEMMRAIHAALDPAGAEGRLRVLCFMTDGEVGNDYQVIAEVQKHPDTRVFAFGIGSSVNRFLLDGVARYGRGEAQYVGLNDDGSAAARRFAERVRNPLLTDIRVEWGGLPVSDVFPIEIPDVFSARPIAISGRFGAPASGVIRIHGRMGGRSLSREIHVSLPASQPENEALATLWARRKVADLSSQDFQGLQRGNMRSDLAAQITRLGLDYRLMTPFTSFVAVEEKMVTEGGGPPRRIEVPVEMPEGMSYPGVFGAAPAGRVGNITLKGRDIGAVLQMIPGLAPSAGSARGGAAGVAGAVGQKVEVTASATPVPSAGPAGWQVDLSAVPPPAPVTLPSPGTGPSAASGAGPQSNKFAPAIAAIAASVRTGAALTTAEQRIVVRGEVRVRLTLDAYAVTNLEQLRKAGFTVTRQEGVTVAGRIAPAKLEALAQFAFVTWIEPQ
jgi:Ca-activated chloride channel homolog